MRYTLLSLLLWLACSAHLFAAQPFYEKAKALYSQVGSTKQNYENHLIEEQRRKNALQVDLDTLDDDEEESDTETKTPASGDKDVASIMDKIRKARESEEQEKKRAQQEKERLVVKGNIEKYRVKGKEAEELLKGLAPCRLKEADRKMCEGVMQEARHFLKINPKKTTTHKLKSGARKLKSKVSKISPFNKKKRKQKKLKRLQWKAKNSDLLKPKPPAQKTSAKAQKQAKEDTWHQQTANLWIDSKQGEEKAGTDNRSKKTEHEPTSDKSNASVNHNVSKEQTFATIKRSPHARKNPASAVPVAPPTIKSPDVSTKKPPPPPRSSSLSKPAQTEGDDLPLPPPPTPENLAEMGIRG
ncbi:MAG: hypothetical protein V6Z78_01265 [Holosporaceae bacterium]